MVAKGTIIKLAVSIELPSGLTMDDIGIRMQVLCNSQFPDDQEVGNGT